VLFEEPPLPIPFGKTSCLLIIRICSISSLLIDTSIPPKKTSLPSSLALSLSMTAIRSVSLAFVFLDFRIKGLFIKKMTKLNRRCGLIE
jgi:hypothetical protein